MSGRGRLRGRRPWAGHGWGGVAAMAAVCALAVAGTLTPLADSAASLQARAAGPATQVRYAGALHSGHSDSCDQSLDPSSGSTDGPAVQRIKARGRLVVGVDQNSYLWGFRDPATGRLAGFDIDIVHAIAKAILGDANAVQFLTVPTDQRIPLIEAGTVDMVVRTMTINCARVREVSFSQPYFEAGQQILAPRTSPISGFDDSLTGKTVCTARGSTGESALEADRHGAKVLLVDNQLDCLVRLQLGLADAVFTDNALAAGQAAQDPSVHLVGHTVTHEPYGVAMKQGEPDLVRAVNAVLNAYRAGGPDSRWMRSYRTWLAADLPGVTGPPDPEYR